MRARILTAVVSILAVAGVAAVTTSTADSASSSDAVAYRTLQSGMLVGFYDDAQVYGRTDWAFKQLRGLRAGIVRITIDWSTVAKRRPAEARRPGGQGLQLDGRRQRDLEGGREQGPRARDDLRDPALGRPRQKPSSSPHDRPAPLLARRRPSLQRHVPRRGRRERACAQAPGRPPLARVERAEQPRLPEAAVEAVPRRLAASERLRLREDLLGRLGRSPLDPPRRREGRLRRHGPAGERRPAQLAPVHLAARLHDLAAPRRPQALRRLRAPPVLLEQVRAARHRPDAPRSRSRSGTSAC